MPRAYVRVTGPAVDDLQVLARKDPQVLRWALKKMLLLERDPEAGEPLVGGLIGWRKLTAGDRDWRVVWRVDADEVGTTTITISEVWAVGARSDAEVYKEMDVRVSSLGPSPTTTALADVVTLFGEHVQGSGISAAAEPVNDPVPDWLRVRLVHTAKVPAEKVDAMTGAEAMGHWEEFMQASH